MLDFFTSLGNGLVEAFTNIFFDDSGKFNIYGYFFLCIFGVSLLLFFIIKILKIFSLFSKEELTFEDNSVPKKVEIKETSVLVSSHKVPLVSRFSCSFCGSITSTNLKNCRNCGSYEFFKVGD